MRLEGIFAELSAIGRGQLNRIRVPRYFHSSALPCKQHLEKIRCYTELGSYNLRSQGAIQKGGLRLAHLGGSPFILTCGQQAPTRKPQIWASVEMLS